MTLMSSNFAPSVKQNRPAAPEFKKGGAILPRHFVVILTTQKIGFSGLYLLSGVSMEIWRLLAQRG